MAKEAAAAARSRSASPSSATPPTCSRSAWRTASGPTSSPRCAPATTPSPTSHPATRLQEAEALRRGDRDGYLRGRPRDDDAPAARHEPFFAAGVPTFEYGTRSARSAETPACRRRGHDDPRLRLRVHPAAVLRGSRAVPLDLCCGEASDLARLDDLCLELFADDAPGHPLDQARPRAHPDRGAAGADLLPRLRAAQEVRPGRQRAHPARARSRARSRSPATTSTRAPSSTRPSSPRTWPTAATSSPTGRSSTDCSTPAACATSSPVQANYSMGEAVHTGVTMIADGTEEADLRLDGCTDRRLRHRRGTPRPGRLRGGQGGRQRGPRRGSTVPLWWTPTATFGPEDD